MINYGYYENDYGPVLFMQCRDENNERVILEIQDKIFEPVFYILKDEESYFLKLCKSYYLDHLITRISDGPPTYLNEPTTAIYTKYPGDVRRLRDITDSMLTFQADVKWEKKVIQQMKWKQFLEVKNYEPGKFTYVGDIKNSNKVFDVKQRICYWDIETSNAEVPTLKQMWKYADKYSIISYVMFDNYTKTFYYYAWKNSFEPKEYSIKFESSMIDVKRRIEEITEKYHQNPEKWSKEYHDLPNIKGHPILDNYEYNFDVIVKEFNDETEMHKKFISDFHDLDFDGVVTFNGRGGNKKVKSKGGNKQWLDGFDMPVFIERCKYLGLKDEIQQLSPLPVSYRGLSKVKVPVKNYIRRKKDEIIKNEVHIECVPQHDIYFDNEVLFFTKDEEKMKNEKLDTYMRVFLGIHKVEHDEPVWELFSKDYEKERKYNIVDVEGMYLLDLFFGYTDSVAMRALLYGGKIEDTIYTSKIHDHINLWYASGDYVMNTRTNRRKSWKGFIKGKMGGYNMDIPDSGIIMGYPEEEFGMIVDFSKLYPTCSMTVNAGVRTKIEFDHYDENRDVVDNKGKVWKIDDLCSSPSGYFRKDFESQNTQIYKDLIKERTKEDKKAARYKKLAKDNPSKKEEYMALARTYEKRSFSYKGLINGKYGADGMGSDKSDYRPRNYDLVVYNTPPSMGQKIIKHLLYVVLPNHGYEPFYASTDSAMVKCESKNMWDAWNESQELSRKINEDLDRYINEEFNPIHNYINIGCEKIFNQCLLFNKRMYMLNTVIEETKSGPIEIPGGKAYIRGLEYLKNNSSLVTTEVQYEIIQMIMKFENKETIRKYIRKVNEEFETYGWTYVSERASISRHPDDGHIYSQNYNACRNANKFTKKDYIAGSRPYLGLFRSTPSSMNGIGSSELYWNNDGLCPIAFDDWDQEWMEKRGFRLDYNKHKKVQLIDKIERFISLIWNITYDDFVEQDFDPCEV